MTAAVPGRGRSRLTALVVAVAVALGLAAGGTGPAAAETVSPQPSGDLVLDGRGQGPGMGLSQWGAYGAAAAGRPWTDIVAFYYPGTSRAGQGNPLIRVLMTADADGTTEVEPATGLASTSGGQRHELPSGSFITSWRVARAADGALTMQYRDTAGRWLPYAYPGRLAADVTFTTDGGRVRLVLADGTRTELRHSVRAVLDGGRVRSVAVMPTEDYLRSVVPRRMSPGWHISALSAQAVAARTLSARQRADAAGALWDTCDTSACQLFPGTARYAADGTLLSWNEHARTDQALVNTAGVVLLHGEGSAARPALTAVTVSNGGYSVAGGSAYPYLVARSDPYDGLAEGSPDTWQVTVPASRVEAAYPSIGTLRAVRVVGRDRNGQWGGRVTSVAVEGTAGAVSVTGAAFSRALGLRSTWWWRHGDVGFPRDWDSDRDADVLARDSAGALWLYPGDGSGSFERRRQIGWGWSGLDLLTHAGDWDGDRSLDLLARAADGSLRLYSGNGRGGFASARTVGRGWGGFAAIVSPGDWDGDGNPDVLGRHTNGSLWLYPGTGLGGFGRGQQVGTGWGGMDLLAGPGDWDGDRVVDLVARQGATGQLWLYPGNGTGGFGRARQIGSGWSGIDRLTGPGDWDGDGLPDLLARVAQSGELRVYLGAGGGRFLGSRSIGAGWTGYELVR